MQSATINVIYDRISKILKNDQKYSYSVMGSKIVACTASLKNLNTYYNDYPPLLDIIEFGASLEHETSSFQVEILHQIHYKMNELRSILPELN